MSNGDKILRLKNAKKLSSYIKDNGIKVSVLCHELGISPKVFYNWETGKYNIPNDKIDLFNQLFALDLKQDPSYCQAKKQCKISPYKESKLTEFGKKLYNFIQQDCGTVHKFINTVGISQKHIEDILYGNCNTFSIRLIRYLHIKNIDIFKLLED